MTRQNIACIILAAGKGTRMKSVLSKPLHKVAGREMVRHAVAAAEALDPAKIVIVSSPDSAAMAAAVRPHTVVVQSVVNGTGGAALAAEAELRDFEGDILILYGDSPLITPETLLRLVDARRQDPPAGLVFAGVRLEDGGRYGRMILDADGTLERIVEYKDATPAHRAITLCNSGFTCADGARLFGWLKKLGNDNAAGEYYLTHLPEVARRDNALSRVIEIPEEETAGANDRAELAGLERQMQQKLRRTHMLAGATLEDPDTVYFSFDTVLGQDVTVGPSVVFGPGVTVGDGARIHAFSHLEGATVAPGAIIGPFARLRPGTDVGEGARVGNFVETKKARIGAGAKINHLAYIGDAEVGEGANIGAGTITCNYDGYAKFETKIGKGAFIGSNTALVAPVSVGEGAIVGAGSVITKDVPADALGIARAVQRNIAAWASSFRRDREGE